MTTARETASCRVDGVSAPSLQCAEVWGGNAVAHTPVELPGLRGVLYSRPCRSKRGGDLHYLSICGSGLLARVCLADVVGHGDDVDLVGREIHGLLRRFVNWPDHRRMLERLNRSLLDRGLRCLTTAVALTYYPPSRRLSVSYAGHPPGWYYRRADRRWERLTETVDREERRPNELVNATLGVVAEATFTRRRLRASVGDRLLLVTDGVIETPDPSNRRFDADLVKAVLDEHRARDVGELADRLLAALEHHCARPEFAHDDVTFLLLEFTEPPPGPALWHVVRNRVARLLPGAGAGR